MRLPKKWVIKRKVSAKIMYYIAESEKKKCLKGRVKCALRKEHLEDCWKHLENSSSKMYLFTQGWNT